jgi:hypothetical protein
MSKLLISSFAVQLLAIGLFTIIYSSLPTNAFVYVNNKKGNPNLIDFFNLSTTTQAGVGLSNLLPNTELALLTMTLQQIIMIAKNIVILYFFTL